MDIKKVLEDELNNVISGKSDIKKSKVVCGLAAQIIYKDRLEVESKINEARIRYWDKVKK